MQRSRLRNEHLEAKTTAARIAYKKQKCYYENLDTKNVTDNKKFWGTVKPLFSNEVRSNTFYRMKTKNQ